MKYLGIKLTKYTQDLHKENKTLLNEMGELNKWDIPCSWLKRFNVLKISVIFKVIHGFNAISIKIPETYLVDKNKFGGLTLPDLKTYHKTRVIKTVWFCQNN